ncbi:MAG: RNA pseudouridine synthase [Rhodoferax sp.]|nr:RNA pseudouridine synthase [Rhodoferax sp.]
MSTTPPKPARPLLRKPEKPTRPATATPAPVATASARPQRPLAQQAPAPQPPSNKKPRLRKPRKDAPEYQAPPSKEETGERLSKRVMQLKGCSRKEAEQYIEAGFVTVNGVVVEEPALRIDRQTVAIDPQASLLAMVSVTLILNKPPGTTDGLEDPDDDDEAPPRPAARGPGSRKAPPPNARSLLTPQTHWAHDPSETRVLKRHFKNLEADIELETGASGLVVFTEDWRTTRKLTEDMATMEHEFLVEVKGEVAPEALKPIGYALKDDRLDLPQVKVSVSSSTPEMSRLRFAIKGSHPGLVAYLCGLANLDILAMRRVRLGRVSLADLPIGQWRFLADYEKF